MPLDSIAPVRNLPRGGAAVRGAGQRAPCRAATPTAALAVLALLAAAPLARAPRRPAAVLALLLAEAAAASALGLRAEQIWPLYPATTLLIAAVAAARTPRTGCAAALTALAVQETVLQVDLFRDGGRSRVFAPGFLGLTACLALLVLMAWSAGAYVRQRRAYGEALRAHAAAQAVTAERLRIARELHDMAAHSIGVVAIQAGAARRILDSEPERARDALSTIESTSRDTLRGLRSMLGLLRRMDPQPPPVAATHHSRDLPTSTVWSRRRRTPGSTWRYTAGAYPAHCPRPSTGPRSGSSRSR
ncbi:histidine kinase dimerization/phosphoacceptor domain-containing protein [Streptomyces sp. NBC_00069]|uniref:histidine kinase dimerization/phosphoacceptor domain-containing protein n=1 Tax=Streptomyces sp. NBC_00069 TaxID=2975639 RepID=UPI002F91878E